MQALTYCVAVSEYTAGQREQGSSAQGFRDKSPAKQLASAEIAAATVLDDANITTVRGFVSGMTSIGAAMRY